jgi:hypothetical protein
MASLFGFTAADVQNVFGVPCGPRSITSASTDLSDACLHYIQLAEEFSDKGTRSLKAAEKILLKELTPASRKIDVDCFKIAFVVFAVGHVLSPSSKHDYTSIDYWQVLSNINNMHDYDWGEYVLRNLMSAVRKLKQDLHTRHTAIHLLGCHLFFF